MTATIYTCFRDNTQYLYDQICSNNIDSDEAISIFLELHSQALDRMFSSPRSKINQRLFASSIANLENIREKLNIIQIEKTRVNKILLKRIKQVTYVALFSVSAYFLNDKRICLIPFSLYSCYKIAPSILSSFISLKNKLTHKNEESEEKEDAYLCPLSQKPIPEEDIITFNGHDYDIFHLLKAFVINHRSEHPEFLDPISSDPIEDQSIEPILDFFSITLEEIKHLWTLAEESLHDELVFLSKAESKEIQDEILDLNPDKFKTQKRLEYLVDLLIRKKCDKVDRLKEKKCLKDYYFQTEDPLSCDQLDLKQCIVQNGTRYDINNFVISCLSTSGEERFTLCDPMNRQPLSLKEKNRIGYEFEISLNDIYLIYVQGNSGEKRISLFLDHLKEHSPKKLETFKRFLPSYFPGRITQFLIKAKNFLSNFLY